MLARPAVVTALAALAAALASDKPPITPPATPAKESFQYAVEWRLITAGKARLEWRERGQPVSGYQADLHLESAGLVSKLYKVNDDYSAMIDADLCTTSAHIMAQEGKRRRETSITFDRESRKASYLETDIVKKSTVASNEIEIPACVHDIVGGLFYLRTLKLEPGETAQVPVSDGKKSVSARVEAQQREEVKTPAGAFKTMRYEVFVFNNVLYRRNARLFVWISEDAARAPVQIRVRMQFTIGTITLQLVKHERS